MDKKYVKDCDCMAAYKVTYVEGAYGRPNGVACGKCGQPWEAKYVGG
jgi:hypothetical protein